MPGPNPFSLFILKQRCEDMISDFGPNNENKLNSSRHALRGVSTENSVHVKIFFDRISLLERENQKLSNENLALKIENNNMKVMKFQGNQAAHNQNGNKKGLIAMAGMKTPIAC